MKLYFSSYYRIVHILQIVKPLTEFQMVSCHLATEEEFDAELDKKDPLIISPGSKNSNLPSSPVNSASSPLVQKFFGFLDENITYVPIFSNIRKFSSKEEVVNYLLRKSKRKSELKIPVSSSNNSLSEVVKEQNKHDQEVIEILGFVFSLMLTRGLENIKNDMFLDDEPLVARFGHCSQEIVNLMLLGEATPNVFDGVRNDTGMEEKGVLADQVDIGYLSEMEAERYVQVGSRYKNPNFNKLSN